MKPQCLSLLVQTNSPGILVDSVPLCTLAYSNLHSLVPWRCGNDFKNVISKQRLRPNAMTSTLYVYTALDIRLSSCGQWFMCYFYKPAHWWTFQLSVKYQLSSIYGCQLYSLFSQLKQSFPMDNSQKMPFWAEILGISTRFLNAVYTGLFI